VKTVSFDELPPCILSFDELPPCILSFDELPPYPVRSFTSRNQQVRADEVQRVIVYSTSYQNKVQNCTVQNRISWKSYCVTSGVGVAQRVGHPRQTHRQIQFDVISNSSLEFWQVLEGGIIKLPAHNTTPPPPSQYHLSECRIFPMNFYTWI
jgi:hypothetical protein